MYENVFETYGTSNHHSNEKYKNKKLCEIWGHLRGYGRHYMDIDTISVSYTHTTKSFIIPYPITILFQLCIQMPQLRNIWKSKAPDGLRKIYFALTRLNDYAYNGRNSIVNYGRATR